jgi:tetratricopeptide (TPR) repeat protein
VALVAATVAVAVTANTYRITKDFNRGLLALERGDMTVAYEHLRAAHGAGVRTSGLYNALAWAAIESGAGSPAEAVRLAEESLRLRPGNADALDTYGWALHKSGRSAEALVPLMEALKKKPRMYCIHYHLGAAYLGSGDIVRASGHLQRQIDEQPQTREAMLAVELLARIARSSTN